MVSSIIFIVVLLLAGGLFTKKVLKLRRNILLGKDLDRSGNRMERLKMMMRVALGQSKMVKRPVAGILHVIVYVGFIIINIEVLEIVIDGIIGSHRIMSGLGGFYTFLIASFEILALLTWVACVIFLIRRNVIRIKRFWGKEMTAWPRSDANIILITEIALMTAFLFMNASDQLLMQKGVQIFNDAGEIIMSYAGHEISQNAFPVSSLIANLMGNVGEGSNVVEAVSNGYIYMLIERGSWWFHIIVIFAFLNYLPYSKHFHIILAFPNTYYSNLEPQGRFTNMESVTNEVKLMLDPTADPYATPAPDANAPPPSRFGAKDVTDLTWKQLMDAYTCTECGRCSDVCPANGTGKLLSPRKIMMDVRDRLEEVGQNIDKHGKDHDDGKSLLHDYIMPEEIWACTSCNACTEACPVNNDPLSVIVDLRRYVVMEESGANPELNTMFTNIENNQAPWQFSPADRFNWASEDS